MSRKETIIICVIVNIGILALLFVLATREDEGIIEKSDLNQTLVEVFTPFESQNPPQPVSTPISRHQETQFDSPIADEVDIVLQDFALAASREGTDLSSSMGEEYSPPAPPPAAAFNTDEYVEVTVKRGDALEKIARANGTTVEAIKKANRLSTDKLRVGQVLLVPAQQKISASSVSSTAHPAKSVTLNEQKSYTVKSGDNPWKIARQFNISVDQLLQANNLDEERARNLKIGQQLKIP